MYWWRKHAFLKPDGALHSADTILSSYKCLPCPLLHMRALQLFLRDAESSICRCHKKQNHWWISRASVLWYNYLSYYIWNPWDHGGRLCFIMCLRDNWKAACSDLIVFVRMSILYFLALLRSSIASLYCAMTRWMCAMDIARNELDFSNRMDGTVNCCYTGIILTSSSGGNDQRERERVDMCHWQTTLSTKHATFDRPSSQLIFPSRWQRRNTSTRASGTTLWVPSSMMSLLHCVQARQLSTLRCPIVFSQSFSFDVCVWSSDWTFQTTFLSICTSATYRARTLRRCDVYSSHLYICSYMFSSFVYTLRFHI